MNKKFEDEIFALDPAHVQVDDIVLTSGSGLLPFSIRQLTLSNFSHAALCTRLGFLFEAVRGGVLRRSVIGTFAERAKWIKVLRPEPALDINGSGMRVSNYAERMYGRAYSFSGAFTSQIRVMSAWDDGAVICSQVVAQAFKDYGCDLLPGRDPSKVDPSMFLNSSRLIDVSHNCVRRLGSISDKNLYKQVLAIAEEESPGSEMAMNRRVFESLHTRLNEILPLNIYSLSDLWEWLAENGQDARRADLEILAILESDGFLGWYEDWIAEVQKQTEILEGLAAIVELARNEPKSPDVCDMIREIGELLPLSAESLEGRRDTMKKYELLSQQTGLNTIAYFCRKYRAEFDIFERSYEAKCRLYGALRNLGQAPTIGAAAI